MSPWLRRIGWWFQRRNREETLRAELQFHLEEEARERREDGMTEERAASAARRDLGNVTLVREDARALWTWTLLDHLTQDLRFAGRTMWRNRTVTIVAGLTLALGIGANTAIYSVVSTVLFDPLPGSSGDELSRHGAAIPVAGGRPIQFLDVYPRTPDRKIDLFPEYLDAQSPEGLYGYQPDPATNEFPLALISPASERTISSTLSELPRPEVRLLMHPEDAAARSLKDGDEVRIFNALGEVRCGLQVGTWVRPGTVVLPKGLWRKHSANGFTANALAPDSLTDLGGGACFNDARVDVRKVSDSVISSANGQSTGRAG